MVVFSLRRWSSVLPSGFLVSRRTLGVTRLYAVFVYGAFTLFRLSFQISSTNALLDFVVTPNPLSISTKCLGSSYFARHYFRNRVYFLFLRVIRCFSSPGSPRITIDSLYDTITLLIVSSLIRISTAITFICNLP